jgi:hypothetical protein
VLERIEKVDVHGSDSSPVIPITIVDCGELDRKNCRSVTTENGIAWNFCEIYQHLSIHLRIISLFANKSERAYISY